jgi:hypothetical protein
MNAGNLGSERRKRGALRQGVRLGVSPQLLRKLLQQSIYIVKKPRAFDVW